MKNEVEVEREGVTLRKRRKSMSEGGLGKRGVGASEAGDGKGGKVIKRGARRREGDYQGKEKGRELI